MKKLLATTIIVAMCATTAGATGWGLGGNTNSNTAVAHGGKGGAGGNASQSQGQGQNQGQAQGQGQSQASNSSASSSSSTSSSSAGGSAMNAGNAQNLNITSNYDEAAYSPDVNVGDCQIGLSAGIPGAVAGVGIPSKHCRVLVEAELIEYYWGKNAAGQHLYDNNPRIRRTVKKRISNQQVGGKLTGVTASVSTVSAPRGEDR